MVTNTGVHGFAYKILYSMKLWDGNQSNDLRKKDAPMKKIMKKPMNALLSLALTLILSAAVVVPATGGVISPMSDDLPVLEFYI